MPPLKPPSPVKYSLKLKMVLFGHPRKVKLPPNMIRIQFKCDKCSNVHGGKHSKFPENTMCIQLKCTYAGCRVRGSVKVNEVRELRNMEHIDVPYEYTVLTLSCFGFEPVAFQPPTWHCYPQEGDGYVTADDGQQGTLDQLEYLGARIVSSEFKCED